MIIGIIVKWSEYVAWLHKKRVDIFFWVFEKGSDEVRAFGVHLYEITLS